MTNVAEGVEIDEDIDFGTDDLVDLGPLVARMRADKPASWVRFIGEPALHLNTYELVSAGFREEGSIPGHLLYLQTQQPVMGWTVQSLSGAAHRTARAPPAPAGPSGGGRCRVCRAPSTVWPGPCSRPFSARSCCPNT